MAMDDFLGLEPLLIQRIDDCVGGFRGQVFGAPELGTFSDARRSPPAPSCDVVYGGYLPLEDRGDGVTRVRQTWYVVPRVRNVRDVKSGQSAREEGSALIGQTLAALLGWKPSDNHKALVLAPAPPPEYLLGKLEMPLAFFTEIVVKPTGD